MSSSKTGTAAQAAPASSNPLDAIPDEMPFDVPYGPPISLDRALAIIRAAVAEAKNRNWKMNIAVVDSGGNLVAFQRMDDAMLASIQIAEHKARAAATFRRPTKVFEDGVNLMHLNYLLAFDGIIASRGGIPLIEEGKIIGAVGCSGGADSQDEVVSKAGAAVIGSRYKGGSNNAAQGDFPGSPDGWNRALRSGWYRLKGPAGQVHCESSGRAGVR
jgi:glc operon protein GlcG